MNRGDVILVRFPHPSGLRGKKRPAVVVQSDAYAGVVRTFVVEVTSILTMASDPACLFVDTSTPGGRATGLRRDSVVSCLVLVTIYEDTVDQVLGTLSPAMRLGLDDCLKAALGLP
jgi:mRNA-degrading endonuclease toxin of MazEF toxin-antitoxin module